MVKLFPVIEALRSRNHRVLLVTTGQHADLAPRMLSEFGLLADAQLAPGVAGLAPAQLLASILARLSPLMAAHRPALVLVQGDTVSTVAGALAASYAQLPVAHVEAGLRTGDPAEPHPEEMHRQLVAPLASLHFAPTRRAAAALLHEGIAADRIHITGNSGIDALFATRDRLAANASLRADLAARYPFARADRPLLLVTVHRRENIGPRLSSIASALAHLAAFDDMAIVMPLHPNPAVRGPLQARLGALPNVHLLDPLDHHAMVWMMQRASLLLTDSGGLQEEAPSLGLRTLVLRSCTERPEAVEAGASELVPLVSESIVGAVKRLLATQPMDVIHPFGDGRAGERIAHLVDQWLGARHGIPMQLARQA